MAENLPIILIPGLGTSPRTYSHILPALWKHSSVTIANQTKDASIETIAKRILAAAPPRFALIGHSMGGYIAFEILRQAPSRVSHLALLNSSARPDNDEAKEKRKKPKKKEKRKKKEKEKMNPKSKKVQALKEQELVDGILDGYDEEEGFLFI